MVIWSDEIVISRVIVFSCDANKMNSLGILSWNGEIQKVARGKKGKKGNNREINHDGRYVYMVQTNERTSTGGSHRLFPRLGGNEVILQ